MPSFAGEPPRKKSNKPPSSPPSFFSSLPVEIVLEIIPRVPKRYQPILSCVSKDLANLVRSPEIQKTRTRLGLDSLYVCFTDESSRPYTSKWFTLRRSENDPTQNVVASIEIPSPSLLNYSSAIAIGPEIFFVCGTNVPSSNFLIYDSRTRKFRRAPNMLGSRLFNSVGLVGEKIYVIGGRESEIVAESFDLKKKIWEVAPVPEFKGPGRWTCATNVSFDRKVCAMGMIGGMDCYDTRDGSCENLGLPDDKWWRTGVCVIANVLYVYYARFGLMWFDTKLMVWRIVDGLREMKKVRSVAMAEYYGKLAFFWKDLGNVEGESKDVWCRMIALDKSGVGIRGTAEPAKLLGSVPLSYRWRHCLSVSDD